MVINRQFNDIDVFAEAIKPLNIKADQLTPGGFLGTVNVANLGSLEFTHLHQNQAIQMKPWRSKMSTISCGMRLR